MSRRLILAWALLVAATSSASAQAPFAQSLVPSRTALSRLGLERQWMAAVPLTGAERVIGLSLSGDLFFAQTNSGFIHTYNAETGALLWSTHLGSPSAVARPISANSFGVFVSNLDYLYAIDRNTGNLIWKKELYSLPGSPTAVDEDRVMVGLDTGKVFAFNLKTKVRDQVRISDRPIDAWNWQAGGAAKTRPLLAGRFAIFGADDGKVYVALADEPTLLYRFATGGPIGEGFGAHGTRLLLVPSADHILYGVDLLTAQPLWTYGTGAPIKQAPLVSDQEIFVLNEGGRLSSVTPGDGTPKWVCQTPGHRLVGVGATRVYLETSDHDLYFLDRSTGRVAVGPQDSLNRAGLNLRPYDLELTNFQNDRLFFGTSSGLVICLREEGQVQPHLLRDPKAKPFGYIPPEGVTLTPGGTSTNVAPAPPEGEAPAPGADPAEPPAP